MKLLKTSLIILLLGFVISSKADELPWKKYGFDIKVVTLSNGKYQEFHDLEDVVQIGSVLYDSQTKKIVGFVKKDSLISDFRVKPHIVSRWFCPDPLTEEYSSWSPYNYVMNNPLKFIDPDGQKVVFANGSSKKFKQQFAKAVQHLNKHKAGGMLAKLQDSKTTYFISEGVDKGTYNRKTKVITWDPDMGGITNEGHILSPTSILNHEVDHALQNDKNGKQYNKDRKTKDSQYGNKEEKRVITGSEQETAKKLGEIKEGETTRKDHAGQPYQTKGPTSTVGKYEIIVTGTKKKEKK